jgi:hypothetical protein
MLQPIRRCQEEREVYSFKEKKTWGLKKLRGLELLIFPCSSKDLQGTGERQVGVEQPLKLSRLPGIFVVAYS